MNCSKILHMEELNITGVDIRIVKIPKWGLAQNQLETTALVHIYICMCMCVCVFFVNTYLIKQYRHPLFTHFHIYSF